MPNIKEITANVIQYSYLTSTAPYRAIVSGWGTGKTMIGILDICRQALESPNNLLLICRKEYTDLHDSTMKDFEAYTNITIGSNKEVKFPNGSVIMFRHAKELDVLKNINLGGFLTEQAEEFESDEQYMYLRGRTRRAGVKRHCCDIIANTNGHNWIWRLWKQYERHDPKYALFEATTFDNKDCLPESYLANLEDMRLKAPATYNRFVLNSWAPADADARLINPEWVSRAFAGLNTRPYDGATKRIIGCDYARAGGDLCVVYPFRNYKQLDRAKIMPLQDGVATANELIQYRTANKANTIGLDTCGMGAIVGDMLTSMGQTVLGLNGAAQSFMPDRYVNLRAEMWFYAAKIFQEGYLELIDDPLLEEELTGIKYSTHGKRLQIEDKDDFKARLGRSPDRADALIIAIWTVDKAKPYNDNDPMVTRHPGATQRRERLIASVNKTGGW